MPPHHIQRRNSGLPVGRLLFPAYDGAVMPLWAVVDLVAG